MKKKEYTVNNIWNEKKLPINELINAYLFSFLENELNKINYKRYNL